MNSEEIKKVIEFCFKHQYGGWRDSIEPDVPFEYYLYDRYSQLLPASKEHVDWQINFYTQEYLKKGKSMNEAVTTETPSVVLEGEATNIAPANAEVKKEAAVEAAQEVITQPVSA